ncbi:MAG: hypothetical protein AAB845_00395, partial [Patescibacteria group bacterium]
MADGTSEHTGDPIGYFRKWFGQQLDASQAALNARGGKPTVGDRVLFNEMRQLSARLVERKLVGPDDVLTNDADGLLSVVDKTAQDFRERYVSSNDEVDRIAFAELNELRAN